MKLEGLHHLTMITGDAQRNVDFYAGVLGLRLVKKTVNFDSPDAYHLYFGDEQGSPGTILTWFEFPGAWRGRAGAGMIHTIQLAVPSEAALDFWAERLKAERIGDVVRFADYDGLRYELVVSDAPPRRAEHPEIPAEFAITGIAGARAYGAAGAHALLTETLGLHPGRRRVRLGDFTLGLRPGAGRARPERRGHRPPHRLGVARRGPPRPGASASGRPACTSPACATATTSARSTSASRAGSCSRSRRSRPGFAVDEDPAHLGEELRLPRQHEHLRAQLERTLTPVVNPRQRSRDERRSTASGRRPATPPACSCSTTAAAPTSTTCSASATCSIPSAGCTSSRRARRSRWAAGRAITGTWCRASATPTTTRSTPPTRSSRRCTTSCGSAPASRRSGRCSAASRWAR